MKTVFLHGLGQTAQDWKEVVQQLSISDVDCPELFSSAEDEISYSQILGDLEQRYSEVKEPLRICLKKTLSFQSSVLIQRLPRASSANHSSNRHTRNFFVEH